MHHFYVPADPEDGAVRLSDPERLHHLRDVLRLSAGDEITVFDGRGRLRRCVIESVGERDAVLRVKEELPAPPARARLTVAVALPRSDRMDDIVDKLTQLGAVAIVPVRTERVVSRVDVAGERARLDRWRRIAVSASEQSRRATLPEVRPIKLLNDVLAESSGFDLKLIAALDPRAVSLKAALAGATATSVLVLVGPEGDFMTGEVDAAIGAGFVPVSLGGRVLRVETAAVALASYVMLALDG